jgi:hypothetical protein
MKLIMLGAYNYDRTEFVPSIAINTTTTMSPSSDLRFDDMLLAPSIALWIGGPSGVTTQLHYDETQSFFLQVQGSKRFTFFAPSALEAMYLFPSLHPRCRKSRVNLTLPIDTAKYPAFSWQHAMQVVVQPGQMLYIPAFWFHHVEALDFSVSISIVSDSYEALVLQHVMNTPLPFEEEWHQSKRVCAMYACHVQCTQLAQTLTALSDLDWCMHECSVAYTRMIWNNLPKDLPSVYDILAHTYLTTGKPTTTTTQPNQRYDCDHNNDSPSSSMFDAATLAKFHRQSVKISNYLKQLLKVYPEPHTSNNALGVMRIVAGAFLESMLLWALDDGQRIAALLHPETSPFIRVQSFDDS